MCIFSTKYSISLRVSVASEYKQNGPQSCVQTMFVETLLTPPAVVPLTSAPQCQNLTLLEQGTYLMKNLSILFLFKVIFKTKIITNTDKYKTTFKIQVIHHKISFSFISHLLYCS